MDENQHKFERVEFGQKTEDMLRSQKLWKVLWEFICFIPYGIVRLLGACLLITFVFLVLWFGLTIMLSFFDAVIPLGIGKSIIDWLLAERFGLYSRFAVIHLTLLGSYALVGVGFTIRKFVTQAMNVLKLKKYLKALRLWNDKCQPALNRLPHTSQISDKELAYEVAELYDTASEIRMLLFVCAEFKYRDSLSEAALDRNQLNKIHRRVKELSHLIESIELSIETEMLAQSPIASFSQNKKQRSMSSRERARQRARIERAKRLDS